MIKNNTDDITAIVRRLKEWDTEAADCIVSFESRLHRLTSLLENTITGYFFIDRDGIIREVNGAWLALYGYTSYGEIVGRHYSVLQDEKDLEKADEIFRAILGDDSSGKTGEFCRKRADGTIGYHMYSAQPVFECGEVVGIEGFIHDTTERHLEINRLAFSQFSIEKSSDAIFWISDDAKIIYVNERATCLLGYTREQLMTMTLQDFDICIPQNRWRLYCDEVKKSGFSRFESTYKSRDNNYLLVEISVNYVHFDQQELFCVLARDISQRKLSENALRDSEHNFRALADQASDGIVISDAGGAISYANKRMSEMTGHDQEYLVSMKNGDLCTDDCLSANMSILESVFSGIVPSAKFEAEIVRVDGSVIPAEVSCSLTEWHGVQAVINVIRDMSDWKEAEEKIRDSLREKEVLLREVHHRVKNNIQVIASLLALQASRVEDKRINHLFQESINRVKSMGLIHEYLYASENIGEVNASEYIGKLCISISTLFGEEYRRIKTVLALEPVIVSIDEAIPLSLVVNELLSNAFEHAFAGRDSGTVTVAVADTAGGTVLTVRDDGVGFSDDIDWRQSDSLGLKIVRLLVEKQLGGSLEVSSDSGGAEFSIVIPTKRSRHC